MLSILSCVCWQSIYLLWRNVYLGLLPIFLIGLFVFLLLSCMSCSYILEIKTLSVASFANFLFQSIGCLFIFFIVSFAVQMLISLIRSHLFIFAFIFIALGDWPRKTLLQLTSEMFCLCSLLGVLWCLVLYLNL